jgi:hypothetical protein
MYKESHPLILSTRGKLPSGPFKYACVRERAETKEDGSEKRGCQFAVLKHRIFTFSGELASAVAMLFRLIKENEIWVKSHGAYLQKYTTCADGIAQTRELSPMKMKQRSNAYPEKTQMHDMAFA